MLAVAMWSRTPQPLCLAGLYVNVFNLIQHYIVCSYLNCIKIASIVSCISF